MAEIYNKAGFDFSNVVRNTFLENKGVQLPKGTSTGTTIVGCLYKDGVVLGADTRATAGPIVADKNCEKVCLCFIDLPRGLSSVLAVSFTSIWVAYALLSSRLS
jgi:hypothetical protein